MVDANRNNETAENPETDVAEVVKIRKEKLAGLIAAGKNPFEKVKFERTASSGKIIGNYAEYDAKAVSLAGRLVSKRVMGKAAFAHLLDGDGQIQLYFKRDAVGDDEYAEFKKLDIGDIIGVTGEVFTTHAGEVSIKVSEYELLSKSLLPLPEKWHGLTNTDLRYRQRYVDLIANPSVKDAFVKRSRIITAIREFLNGKGYLEVDTPVLNTIPGGATARPFVTHHNTLGIDMYLRIATELYLKRLIVGGFEKVYEMGRIFRNEGMDPKHNPEFTTIELYAAYEDYNDMMAITEEMFEFVSEKVLGTTDVCYQGENICLKSPWKRITMVDAVKEYAGLDFSGDCDLDALIGQAEAIGVGFADKDLSWGKALYTVFDQKVEEKLIQPTFVIDYPVEVSPLAKKKASDPRLTERFEFFITARELGNAFSELNDPVDQRERFMAQMAERAKGDDEAQMLDEDFVRALEYGMPPTGGLGIGIDRMVMLLTDSFSIRDVLLFPTMKPLGDVNKVNDVKNPSVEEAKAEPEPEPEPEQIDFSKVKVEPLFEETVDFDTFAKSDFRAVKVKECVAVPKSKKLLRFTLDDGTGADRVILSGIHAYYEPEELVGKTCIAIVNLPPRKMMNIDSCGMLLSAVHEEDGEEKLRLLMVDDRIPAGAKLY